MCNGLFYPVHPPKVNFEDPGEARARNILPDYKPNSIVNLVREQLSSSELTDHYLESDMFTATSKKVNSLRLPAKTPPGDIEILAQWFRALEEALSAKMLERSKRTADFRHARWSWRRMSMTHLTNRVQHDLIRTLDDFNAMSRKAKFPGDVIGTQNTEFTLNDLVMSIGVRKMVIEFCVIHMYLTLLSVSNLTNSLNFTVNDFAYLTNYSIQKTNASGKTVDDIDPDDDGKFLTFTPAQVQPQVQEISETLARSIQEAAELERIQGLVDERLTRSRSKNIRGALVDTSTNDEEDFVLVNSAANPDLAPSDPENSGRTDNAGLSVVCFHLAQDATRAPGEMLTYENEKKALRALLMYILGDNSDVCNVLARQPSKGGVKHISHVIAPEFYGPLEETLDTGFAIMVERVPQPHKAAFIDGETWHSLTDYTEKLYKERKCINMVPAATAIRSLIQEIISNKQVKIKTLRLSFPYLTSIQASLRNLAAALETAFQRLIKDWSKADNAKGEGVPVKFYEDSSDVFQAKDIFGPAIAQIIMGLVSTSVSDSDWIRANRDLSLRLGKDQFEITTEESLKNKVITITCKNRPLTSFSKFELLNKLDTMTNREGHFDLDEYNHEAARKITQVALRDDGTLKPGQSKFRHIDSEIPQDADPIVSEDDGCSEDDGQDTTGQLDLDVNFARGHQKHTRRQDSRQDNRADRRPHQKQAHQPRQQPRDHGRERQRTQGPKDDRGRKGKHDSGKTAKRTSFGDRSKDPYVKKKRDTYTSKPRGARTRPAQFSEEQIRAVLNTLQIQQDQESDSLSGTDSQADHADSGDQLTGKFCTSNPDLKPVPQAQAPTTGPTTSSPTTRNKKNYKGTVPKLSWVKPYKVDPTPALADQQVFARGNSPTFVLNSDCLQNKFKNITYHVIIDSGATHTVVPEGLIEQLEDKYITGLRHNPFVNNKDASGNPMTMGEDAYDLSINLKEDSSVKLDLLGAVVLKSGSKHVKRQILLGISDMRMPNYISLIHSKECPDKTQVRFKDKIVPYNRVCFDLARNRFRRTQTEHKLQDLSKDREDDFSDFPNIDFTYPAPAGPSQPKGSLATVKAILDQETTSIAEMTRWDNSWLAHLDNRHQQIARRQLRQGLENRGIFTNQEHQKWKLLIPRSWKDKNPSTNSVHGDGLILTGSTEELVNSAKCPDSRIHTMLKVERIRNQKVNTFTHEEIKIDPLDEVLKHDPLKDLKIAVIRKIVRKYKKVFRGDTGCVTTNNYEVHAEIDLRNSNISPNKVPCYQKRGDKKFFDAVCDKLNEEYADGVIEQNVNGRIVLKHIMPIFSVAKKVDPTTVKVEALTEASNIRLIADCSREINGATVHKGRQGDDIREITRDVAGFTKKGFMFSIDISNCFHCIRLHRDLYPYFGVQHPELGDCYYTRLPQGWISSPAFCKDFLMNILGKYRQNLCRYADDIMGGADTWEEFIEIFEGVLATLQYNNLRLKGKKVQVLGCSVEFLGRRIENGEIKASPHHIKRLNEFQYDSLTTKGLLKQFIGLCTYLSEFRYMANEALSKIRDLANGPNKDKIDWTEENIAAFNKAKLDMNDLIKLHTMDPDLQTFLVTDTSRLATGAVLYQQYTDENGMSSRRYIGLFSKKRIGLTNVHQIPSCVLELSGIAAAATHFRPYLERLSKKLIILTDSLGAVRAYKKYQATGVPSSNMRVSSFLAAMWGHNFDMHHVSSDSEEIQAVDFISRFKNEKHTPECDESTCAVCKQVEFIQGTSRSKESDKAILNNELVATTNRLAKYFKQVKYEDHWCIDMDPEEYIHTMTVCPDRAQRVVRQYGQDAYWKDPSIMINQVKTRRDVNPFHVEFIGPLPDLIANSKMLRKMQDSDSTLRKAREIIRGRVRGKDPPTNKQTQLRTLIHSKMCYIDARGLIVMDKVTRRDKISRLSTVVLLPEHYGASVIKCVHHSYGDSTLNQMLLKVDQHFHIPLIKAKAEAFINKCPGCILMKKKVSPRNWAYSEAPMPEKFGEVILCDEIHRQNRDNVKQRFMFATDCLSRYSKLYHIENKTTAQDFKNVIRKVLKDFARRDLRGKKVIIRADGCTTHSCAKRDSRFSKENNVEIDIHEKHSPLSVGIPELDGRMQKLSPILSKHLMEPNKSMNQVAADAAKDYNRRQGYECYSPNELWTGKLDDTGKKFKVPLADLIDTIKSVRKGHRDRFEKILQNRNKLNKLHIVKHENNIPYGNADRMPLKAGDLVVLNAKWDKNDRCRFMKVTTGIGHDAINWDERLVHLRKLGVMERVDNGRLVSFEAISWVIDGNSPEAQEFAQRVQRIRKNAKGTNAIWAARMDLVKTIVNVRSAGFKSRPMCLESPRANPFYDQKPVTVDWEKMCPTYEHEIYMFDEE